MLVWEHDMNSIRFFKNSSFFNFLDDLNSLVHFFPARDIIMSGWMTIIIKVNFLLHVLNYPHESLSSHCRPCSGIIKDNFFATGEIHTKMIINSSWKGRVDYPVSSSS